MLRAAVRVVRYDNGSVTMSGMKIFYVGMELVESELRRLRHGAKVTVDELVEFFEEENG